VTASVYISVCLCLSVSLSLSRSRFRCISCLYRMSISISLFVSHALNLHMFMFSVIRIIIFENGEGNETFCVCFVHLTVCFCVFGGKHKFQAEGSRDSSAGGKKSRVTRKHVIIGVTCAVVVAMVITGVLVGVKFHLDSAHELVSVIYIAALLSRPS